MKRRSARILAAAGCAFLIFSGMCVLFRMPAYADPGGTLTVRVGYMGYEYQTRKTYTAADLRALGTAIQFYSWVDAFPAPVMMAAEGVPLRNIIVDSGIDPGSVQRYYFRTSDNAESNKDYTSDSLFYTARYWFPNLTNTWDASIGGPGVGAEEGAQQTLTMITLKEHHDRFLAAPEPHNMYDSAGFRLVYGAAYVSDPYLDFHDSLHSITHIDVMLVGSPPEEREDPEKSEDPEKPKEPDAPVGADPSNKTTETGNGAGGGRGNGVGDGTADTNRRTGGTGIGNAEEITLGNGTVIKGREINGAKVLMELSYAGGGGKSDGDDPWSEYDISEDSVPLKLPYERESAAAVSGVVGLSFMLGAVAQGEIFVIRKKNKREGE